MGSARTPWHRLFAAALRERAPRGFEVGVEVQLGTEPQRADIVLIRRARPSSRGRRPLLARLWGGIRADALLELKTVPRPVRQGDLARLLGYGAQYFVSQGGRFAHVRDLLLVLVVASVTPTLELELARMGWVMSPRRGGYRRIRGCTFPTMLVVVDEVVEAEHDDLLRVFGHDKIQRVETATWVREHLVDAGDVPMRELEGYDEVLHKLLEALPLEERLSGLTPDERVAGLTPAQRLAGLAAEERLAGLAAEERVALLPTLPVEVLRALTEDLLARLPEAVRDAIARRLRDEPR